MAEPQHNHPLSPQSIIAGLIVTIIGGVVVAYITGTYRTGPYATPDPRLGDPSSSVGANSSIPETSAQPIPSGTTALGDKESELLKLGDGSDRAQEAISTQKEDIQQPTPAAHSTAPEPSEAVDVPSNEPSRPIHVGGDVRKPVKISAPTPLYTAKAREAGIQGVVIVQAIIDQNGHVRSVKVLKSLPMGLAEQAVEAIKTWKFKPATLNGKPVTVYYNLTANFRLQ